MPRYNRPGPLSSKKKLQRPSKNIGLGDESISDEREDGFHTPERDENATDYDLDLTRSRQTGTLRHSSRSQEITPTRHPMAVITSNVRSLSIETPRRRTVQRSGGRGRENQLTPTSLGPSTSARAREIQQQQQLTRRPPVPQPSPPSNQRRKQTQPRRYAQTVQERNFLKEVKKLQSSTNLLVPRLPFGRLVREIMYDIGGHDLRISYDALSALHESAEMYLTQRLQDAYLLALHAKRVTLMLRDLALINFLRSNSSG